jgi:N-acetylglutamate synthase/N-acetylornithine aminotransferase
LGIKSSRILTCDLSKQYIDINASYKTWKMYFALVVFY